MKKVYGSAKEALDGLLFDGMTIAAGGFGLCGIPELLIAAIRDAEARVMFCGYDPVHYKVAIFTASALAGWPSISSAWM